MTSNTQQADQQRRSVLSVPIKELSGDTEHVPTGLYWAFGEAIQGSLHLYRISSHRHPGPAIHNTRRMSNSDTGELIDTLEDLPSRYDKEILYLRKCKGRGLVVSTDGNLLPGAAPHATCELVVDAQDGCFDLNAACKVPGPAIRRSSQDGESRGETQPQRC